MSENKKTGNTGHEWIKLVGLYVILGVIAGMFIGYFIPSKGMDLQAEFRKMGIEEQRQAWIDAGNFIRGSMAMEGKYNCCIEKACWYCIYKTPGHGEGAACECRQNILDGEHPCGECIGEILEGHGEKELAPYFAKAIAHKIGEQHYGHLKEMISDTYGIAVGDQA